MNFNATTALITFTMRRVFSGKRIVAAAIVLAVPPLVALLLALFRIPGIFDPLMNQLMLHLSLILTAMIYGVALTSSEIEDGTAGYLMLSASPRWLIAIAHVLVTGAILGILATAGIALSYLAASLSPMGVGERAPFAILANGFVAWIGLTTFLSFFVFCGYAFKRSVAVSVASVLVWEFLVTAMPIKLAAFTVTLNLRVLWLHLALNGQRGSHFRSAAGYDLPTYVDASMFVSVTAALFLTLSMIAVMNRSIAGREAA